jgi:hypothetical protein
MTLAQVVYHMSNDTDFASQLSSNPDAALKTRGWKLSKEELEFLLSTFKRGGFEKTSIEDLAVRAGGWR